MPTYVSLLKMSPEGAKAIKDIPKRLEEGHRIVESIGGRVIAGYALFGRYDYLFIVEIPDQKSALKAILKIASEGYASSETLIAVPIEDFIGAVEEI